MTATNTTAAGQHLAEYRLYIDGEQQSPDSEITNSTRPKAIWAELSGQIRDPLTPG